MGVCGCGKSRIAGLLAARLGWDMLEGDSLHPAANVAKMAGGTPLNDADRAPWLDAIAEQILARRDGLVIACSALRRAYRDRLRVADPDLRFLHLAPPREVLELRLSRRQHFMAPSLLDSQLATLEPPMLDEKSLTIRYHRNTQGVIRRAERWLLQTEAENPPSTNRT